MQSPKSIANFFLELAASSGTPLDPMKLQKLVYYANGWYAGYRKQPLLNEPIEAWPYGPVIPSLYHEFKGYGSDPIRHPATEWNSEAKDFNPVAPPVDQDLRTFLSNIWRSYGGYTGIKLSEMTHAPGGPWDVTWRRSGGMRGVDIPTELIADHFATAIAQANSAGA